jgi:hypothetical protein
MSDITPRKHKLFMHNKQHKPKKGHILTQQEKDNTYHNFSNRV